MKCKTRLILSGQGAEGTGVGEGDFGAVGPLEHLEEELYEQNLILLKQKTLAMASQPGGPEGAGGSRKDFGTSSRVAQNYF